MMKTELWWVSVGGAPVEPIRVTLDKAGERLDWYSIGCADPHPADMPGVEWVQQIGDHSRPLTQAAKDEQLRAWLSARKGKVAHAGYRRFE